MIIFCAAPTDLHERDLIPEIGVFVFVGVAAGNNRTLEFYRIIVPFLVLIDARL